MQQFHKYHSIENKERIIDNIRATPGILDVDWVVLEKVHGANFSLTTDGTNVKMGSRTMFLNTEEETRKFFNVGKTLHYLTTIVKNIKNIEYFDYETITVYGEIFGGLYNHPEVKVENVKYIQKGVYYSPYHHFYAFDIYTNKDGVEESYEDYDICMNIFKKYGIMYAEPLFIGNFEDCVQWSNLHKADQTTIPVFFNLPNIVDNVREGHIIKAIKTLKVKTRERLILKDKNKKFSEVRKTNQTQSVALSSDKKVAILNYITTQRLDNVISKLGDIDELKKDENNKGILIRSLIQDALEDILKDFLDMNNKDGIAYIKKTIQKKSAQLVLDCYSNSIKAIAA